MIANNSREVSSSSYLSNNKDRSNSRDTGNSKNVSRRSKANNSKDANNTRIARNREASKCGKSGKKKLFLHRVAIDSRVGSNKTTGKSGCHQSSSDITLLGKPATARAKISTHAFFVYEKQHKNKLKQQKICKK